MNHHANDKLFVLFFVLSFRLISSMTFRVLGFVFDFRQIDGQHWHYDYNIFGFFQIGNHSNTNLVRFV